jgi:hypothetical protein
LNRLPPARRKRHCRVTRIFVGSGRKWRSTENKNKKSYVKRKRDHYFNHPHSDRGPDRWRLAMGAKPDPAASAVLRDLAYLGYRFVRSLADFATFTSDGNSLK